MRLSVSLAAVLLAATSVACEPHPAPPAASPVVVTAPPATAAPSVVAVAPPVAAPSALDEVTRIHGGADPWAVAGYRMGQRALTLLGLPRQSADLDVTHRGPLVPDYAGVADGASAATGASVGKVNLRLEEADVASLVTVYKRKSTGATLALRPTEAFKQRFLNVPRDGLRAASEQVLALRDDEIFEVAPPEATAAAVPEAAPSAPTPAATPPAASAKKGDVRDPWAKRRPGHGNWY